MHHVFTPLKINMEPKNGGLEGDFPFHFGVIFRFHVNAPGCIFCFLKLVTYDLWWCKATLKSGWCIENTDTTTLYNNGFNGSFTMVERHHFGDKFSRTGAKSVAFGSSTKALHLRTSASAAGFSFHFNSSEDSESILLQRLFLVPIKGGIYCLLGGYISKYHLLMEPGNSIDYLDIPLIFCYEDHQHCNKLLGVWRPYGEWIMTTDE